MTPSDQRPRFERPIIIQPPQPTLTTTPHTHTPTQRCTQIDRSDRTMPSLEALAEALSAAEGGAVSTALLYPLEVLHVNV